MITYNCIKTEEFIFRTIIQCSMERIFFATDDFEAQNHLIRLYRKKCIKIFYNWYSRNQILNKL